MDISYSKFQFLVENALHINMSPKDLIQNVNNTFENNQLPLINYYFLDQNAKSCKLLLAAGLQYLNFKNSHPEKIEILAKNVCCLIHASHKSVILLLDTLKKILKDSRISIEKRLDCLFEILVRTSRSSYPVNKPIEELCKITIKFLTPKLLLQQYLECLRAIESSVSSDVNCVLFAELLKYIHLDVLFNSIPALLRYIVHGFCMNITGVQRSYLYKVLVERLDFHQWKDRVFNLFINLFNEFNSNECFMESTKCYFIPISALKYKENFYISCRSCILNRIFCGTALVYLTRRRLCNPYEYVDDIMVYCREKSTAGVGLELLLKTNHNLGIIRFLYDYRWLDDSKTSISSFSQVDFLEDIFHFSVVLLSSTCRTHTELGTILIKNVWQNKGCNTKYRKFLWEIYRKNYAVSPNFIYDFYALDDIQDMSFSVENCSHTNNIGYLTKVSCMQCICLTNKNDKDEFISTVCKELTCINVDAFQNGSFVFSIKTLKLLCEEATPNQSTEYTFELLSKALTILLCNTVNQLRTTDERKLYESALSDILSTMYILLYKNHTEILTKQLLNSCFLTIQECNFKQPVTIASSILQKTAKFATSKTLSSLIDTCFQSLNSNTTNMSTIRCSAEYRLVLENICLAETSGILAKEVFSRLLKILNDDKASEFAIEAALHTTEALLSNKSLHMLTWCYIEDIVELVLEKNWIGSFRTRNAVIQVWRTIINTFKGAPLEKAFLEYNRLAPIFYRTLAKAANEKSLLILSVFIECPQGMHLLKPNLDDILHPFTSLFVHLVLNETGACGRFAAEAYAAQCRPDFIIFVLYDIIAFSVLRGVIANVVILVRLLLEKYLFYFKNCNGIHRILCIFYNIVRPVSLFKKFQEIEFDNEFQIDFLQAALEKTEKNAELIWDTLSKLIIKAINLETKSPHLLQLYTQTIFLLYEKKCQEQTNNFLIFKHTNTSVNYSLHQFAVFSLIFSHGTDFPVSVVNNMLKELFQKYRDILDVQDPEMLSFFASTLHYVYKCARTARQRLTVFKLALIFMANGDTDEEFCKFIASINESNLINLMCSVKKMLSYEHLLYHLHCENLVFEFLVDASVYISQLTIQNETAFYSVDTESDFLVVPAVKYLLFHCFQEFYINKSKYEN